MDRGPEARRTLPLHHYCGKSACGLRLAPMRRDGFRADPRYSKGKDGTHVQDDRLGNRRLRPGRQRPRPGARAGPARRLEDRRRARERAAPRPRRRARLLADEPELEEKIEKRIEELRSVGLDATLEVRSGTKDVATLIAEAAEDVDADLIVVATHGNGGLTAALMGSVARALCHTARRPLLVVPPPPKAAKRPEPAERQPAARLSRICGGRARSPARRERFYVCAVGAGTAPVPPYPASIRSSSSSVPSRTGPLNHLRAETSHQVPTRRRTPPTVIGA